MLIKLKHNAFLSSSILKELLQQWQLLQQLQAERDRCFPLFLLCVVTLLSFDVHLSIFSTG
jgi:hypothetical protein